jgi:hypothetical protein
MSNFLVICDSADSGISKVVRSSSRKSHLSDEFLTHLSPRRPARLQVDLVVPRDRKYSPLDQIHSEKGSPRWDFDEKNRRIDGTGCVRDSVRTRKVQDT